jgi:hypothetical protein
MNCFHFDTIKAVLIINNYSRVKKHMYILVNPAKTLGNPWGKPGETLGKPWGNPGKIRLKLW